MENNLLFIDANIQRREIKCLGNWQVDNLTTIREQIQALHNLPHSGTVTFNGEKLTRFDSSGAWLLNTFREKLEKKGLKTNFEHFSNEQLRLIEIVKKQNQEKKPLSLPLEPNFLYKFGKMVVNALSEFIRFLSFIGYTAIELLSLFTNQSSSRFKDFSAILQKSGFNALPIIALISLMVGVVLAHQTGLQLKNYGANIYIVDFLGFAGLREFGPLLTAIMVAGRTGSAFTAQIGIMKLNQEVDALDTMGITSAELLVIPRLMGLLVALPLLTVWADIFSILGGMIITHNFLNISWQEFITRFQHQIPVRYFLIGLGKAPIFALIIASIGCFQGLSVSGSANSVGERTTRSVVLAIFFIIVADALFSILLSAFNL